MRKKKLMRQLISGYGKAPDIDYFSEDIIGIRTYYQYRRDHKLDAFYLDDTTWNDLSMADVFKQLNATQSTSGEQVLYHMLRTPATTQAAYEKREILINQLEERPSLRLDLQVILARLGKRRAASTQEVFTPSKQSPFFLLLAIFLVVGLIVSVIGALFAPRIFMVPALLFLFINPAYHAFSERRLEHDLATANYAAAMVVSCHKMRRLIGDRLGDVMAPFYAAGNRAKSVARFRGISTAATSDLATVVNLLFLFDLISYESLKRNLVRHQADVFTIHEMLGTIDAAIAVGSYRKGASVFCRPQIDFGGDTPPFLSAEGLVHPLVRQAVPNTIALSQPLLVTGSNASGKSTFLKAVVLNAVLAQSICTALCASYHAAAFTIYTSMAIADHITEKESYFIAEIKSIKRIVDAQQRGERALCVIDEVLRGTNTIERIAASSEVLASLASGRALCLAATHDIELVDLLPAFRQVHFQERIEGGEVLFDYLLKEGPTTTRNAIRLLAMLGFDEELVESANQRAQHFSDTGKWV